MQALELVIGLGNRGESYRATRHNIGFWVVDGLARRWGVSFRTEGILRRVARSASARQFGREVVLAQPLTYMNRSGWAVAGLCRRYGVQPADITVVHDDADLELGRLRVRRGGGSGGHNGLRSLIEALDEDGFTRVRLGIRGVDRTTEDLAGYVLSEFAPHELPVAEELAGRGVDAVECLLEHGLETTMNRYNGTRIGVPGRGRPDEG